MFWFVHKGNFLKTQLIHEKGMFILWIQAMISQNQDSYNGDTLESISIHVDEPERDYFFKLDN